MSATLPLGVAAFNTRSQRIRRHANFANRPRQLFMVCVHCDRVRKMMTSRCWLLTTCCAASTPVPCPQHFDNPRVRPDDTDHSPNTHVNDLERLDGLL